jgi:hypothetical protein
MKEAICRSHVFKEQGAQLEYELAVSSSLHNYDPYVKHMSSMVG